MESNNTPNRIHPLVAGAAISVMLVSLTGVAALTGLIPNSHSTTAAKTAATPMATTPPQAANPLAAAGDAMNTSSSKPQAEERAEEKQAPVQQHRSTTAHATKPAHSRPRQNDASTEPGVVAQAPVCANCGRVESVQAIQHAAKPSGLGVVAGAVVGGLLGNQVGGGNGRTLATVAGAVGGGYAGNEVEKRTHATTTYQVRVRMEDGSIRTLPYTQQPGWTAGDRVRVENGHLTSLG
ncbi:MAG TPA: glycine zipper 2TM domain-containing protein, partial [Noviherbaspirillum sp.]